MTIDEALSALKSETARRERAEAQLAQQRLSLDKALASLAAAERRKDEFLALLAHELRNPLGAIRNAMQIMRVADGDSALTATSQVIVERQVKHLTRLVDDLVDIARITQGKIELRQEPTPVNDIIQMALARVRPQLEGKQHSLQIQLPGKDAYVAADPARLEQVFANLLHNASKYSPTGTPIRVEAVAGEADIVVRIVDAGIGIPADMLERIFELFTQVHSGADGTREGLGIGLTLVRRITELHGGSVTATSAGTEHGSTFTVRLPRMKSQGDTNNVAAMTIPSAQTIRLRILIADDNRDAAQTLAMMLQIEGHEVRAVNDGLQALSAGDTFLPQLVLLDIGMPMLDGYETARRMLERPWGKQAHLVALTGWGQEADRRKAIAAGFHDHLIKPAEPAALNAVIERAATGQSSA